MEPLADQEMLHDAESSDCALLVLMVLYCIVKTYVLIQDSQIVVDCFKSGFEPPGEYPFEDYSQHIYRTVSDGTISTPKPDLMRNDPKITMSKAKGKLWLFGKKPKVRKVQQNVLN